MFRSSPQVSSKLSRIRNSNCALAACAAAVVAIAAGRAPAVSFTPGDLVVSAYGSSGSTLADQTASPISLIEYSTTGGSSILTDTLPTTNGVGASNNLGVVGEYGSSSEGNIQLSGNGQYLTIAGYSASAAAAGINASTNSANGTSFPTGTPFGKSTVDLAQSTDTNVPRMAVLVDSSGNVNSSTLLNDVYSTNNPRSVYSASGSTFYISGQGDGNNNDQGIFNGPVGLNTVTSPSSHPTGIFNSDQTRYVTAANGNLYYSADTSSGKVTGIWQFNGSPTNSATATQIIPGNNGQTGSKEVFFSPEAFFFANPTTLYVADTGDPKAGTLSDGGIQKWTLAGSKWSLDYTMTPATSDWIPAGNPRGLSNGESGFAALTGEVVGSGPTATVDLFAVSYTLGDDNPNGLYAIADTLSSTTGSGETFNELEKSAGDGALNFKGVSFAPTPVPEPASLALLSVAGIGLLSRRKAR